MQPKIMLTQHPRHGGDTLPVPEETEKDVSYDEFILDSPGDIGLPLVKNRSGIQNARSLVERNGRNKLFEDQAKQFSKGSSTHKDICSKNRLHNILKNSVSSPNRCRYKFSSSNLVLSVSTNDEKSNDESVGKYLVPAPSLLIGKGKRAKGIKIFSPSINEDVEFQAAEAFVMLPRIKTIKTDFADLVKMTISKYFCD